MDSVYFLQLPASGRPCPPLEWRIDPAKGAQIGPSVAGVSSARAAAIAAGIRAAESRAWLQYCACQCLVVKLWDAASQLQLGHASVPVARLLRRQQQYSGKRLYG